MRYRGRRSERRGEDCRLRFVVVVVGVAVGVVVVVGVAVGVVVGVAVAVGVVVGVAVGVVVGVAVGVVVGVGVGVAVVVAVVVAVAVAVVVAVAVAMSVEGVNAYPLSWPGNWKRTPRYDRERSRYQVSHARALAQILVSIRQMGGVDPIISTNVELRRDGLPYANAREPEDPGVAVYWMKNGKPQVMACDHWQKVWENTRAIGLALEAMRALERSGATQIFDKAFAGFAALPAHGQSKPWRDVLGVSDQMKLSRELIEQLYRELARIHHPDRDGSHQRMAEINKARDEALRILEGGE